MCELMFTLISQIRLWTHRQKGHISYHFVVSSQCEAHSKVLSGLSQCSRLERKFSQFVILMHTRLASHHGP